LGRERVPAPFLIPSRTSWDRGTIDRSGIGVRISLGVSCYMSGTPPPRPDPPSEPLVPSPTPALPGPTPPKSPNIRALLIGLGAVVAVTVVVSLVNKKGADCGQASASALSAIASGAQHKYEPMTLTDGMTMDSTITFATGERQDGILVAATTPVGTGVWVLTPDAYASGGGLIFAVNDVAKSTTIWGRDTNFDPADPSDATAVEACVNG
jgi:hypothetical protein